MHASVVRDSLVWKQINLCGGGPETAHATEGIKMEAQQEVCTWADKFLRR
jgi:hypothetical protein